MLSKLKRLYLSKIKLLTLVGIALLVCFVTLRILFSVHNTLRFLGLTPTAIGQLLFSSGVPLKEYKNRTNIVILGIGGASHEGSDLTDTMLVLSFPTKGTSFAMISVPRDIWSETLKDKVNSAYHYGEEKKKGGGAILTKSILEDVVGMPVQYTILIDFSEFTHIIDSVGGIDVDVQEAFVDTEYPIAGKENDPCGGDIHVACRYETIRFERGTQHMDGVLALKYVRSRHAQGEEGTDFARGRRQQEVFVALKKKLFNPALLVSPSRLLQIIGLIRASIRADMTMGELATVGKFVAKIPQSRIQKISIEPFFINPPLSESNGRYILVPKTNWENIHTEIQSQLSPQ